MTATRTVGHRLRFTPTNGHGFTALGVISWCEVNEIYIYNIIHGESLPSVCLCVRIIMTGCRH